MREPRERGVKGWRVAALVPQLTRSRGMLDHEARGLISLSLPAINSGARVRRAKWLGEMRAQHSSDLLQASKVGKRSPPILSPLGKYR